MGDALQVNDSSMQALAAYLQKTLEPSTRHEGIVRVFFTLLDNMGTKTTSHAMLAPFATKKKTCWIQQGLRMTHQ